MKPPLHLLTSLILASLALQGVEVHSQTMAQGWAAADKGDRFGALRAFSQVLQNEPENQDARRAISNLLAELGAPYGAAAALQTPPDIGLQSRQATSLVRWGQQVKPFDPTQRYATTDLALARLNTLLDEARRLQPRDAGLEVRLQRDLAVALRDRKRWQDVLNTTAALRQQGDALPGFVRHAEADALLALRRPQEARLAYAEVLAADPQNKEALDGRFYAEVEAEDFAAAIATADAALASQSPSRKFGSAQTTEANPDWLDAQIRAAQVRSYADLPADAWERLLPLAEGAPALGYLRAAVGGVAAQRGWTRRAEQEIAIANSLAPDDMGMAVAMVESDLRRRQWARAESALKALQTTYADDGAVQRAARDLANYKAPELRIETSTHHEDGGGGINAPGTGNDTEVRFYTSPIAERWRITAAATRGTATLPEGDFVRERLGAGVEGRWPDMTVEAMGWANIWLHLRNYAVVGGLLVVWIAFWSVYRSKDLKPQQYDMPQPEPLPTEILCERYGVEPADLMTWQAQQIVTVSVAQDSKVSLAP